MSWSKESELKEQRPIYDPCLNGQAYENQGHWDKIISGEAFLFQSNCFLRNISSVFILIFLIFLCNQIDAEKNE